MMKYICMDMYAQGSFVFNTSFNNILDILKYGWTNLLVNESGVIVENHRPAKFYYIALYRVHIKEGNRTHTTLFSKRPVSGKKQHLLIRREYMDSSPF
jgi:hypothetical protein